MNRKKDALKPDARNRWLNLGLVALLTYLLVFTGMQIYLEGWCAACDYCAFLSAGQVINDGQIVDIYDLDTLESYQREVFTAANSMSPEFEVLGILYLPVFILPFSLFALLEFKTGLILWMGINIIGLILYLRFFIKKLFGHQPRFRLILILMLSLPVYQTIFYGQVNLLLVIAVGEFYRALKSDKFFLAGLWLGGLLIKPQLLILILPFLLIQRRFKALGGFAVAALGVGGASFALVGLEGLIRMKDAVLAAAAGGVSSNPMFMMNWRMLGIYLSSFTWPVLGEVFTIGLSLITALLTLFVFRKRMTTDDPRFTTALLAVMAATTLIAPHAHTHTAVILLPVLVASFLRKELPQKLFYFWAFFPMVVNFCLYLLGAAIKVDLLPTSLALLILVLYGTAMLISNLILLVWSLRWKREELVSPEDNS